METSERNLAVNPSRGDFFRLVIANHKTTSVVRF